MIPPDEVWEEIDRYIKKAPQIQPEDITRQAFAERFGITMRSAIYYMDKFARDNADRWEMLRVRSVRNGVTTYESVLRRKPDKIIRED